MSEPCGCGSTNWYLKRITIGEGVENSQCTECSTLNGMVINDVYFDKPGDHHGLYDKMGKPVFVGSKAEKAHELKKRGLREAGDRVHGATSFDNVSHRHAMKSLERRIP